MDDLLREFLTEIGQNTEILRLRKKIPSPFTHLHEVSSAIYRQIGCLLPVLDIARLLRLNTLDGVASNQKELT